MNTFEKHDGNNSTIYHGNCLDVFKHIENSSVDLIFADPPYNIGKQFGDFKDVWPSDKAYAEWCYEWLEQCIKKLKPTGSMYVMTSTQAMPYFDLWLRERITILLSLIHI